MSSTIVLVQYRQAWQAWQHAGGRAGRAPSTVTVLDAVFCTKKLLRNQGPTGSSGPHKTPIGAEAPAHLGPHALVRIEDPNDGQFDQSVMARLPNSHPPPPLREF